MKLQEMSIKHNLSMGWVHLERAIFFLDPCIRMSDFSHSNFSCTYFVLKTRKGISFLRQQLRPCPVVHVTTNVYWLSCTQWSRWAAKGSKNSQPLVPTWLAFSLGQTAVISTIQKIKLLASAVTDCKRVDKTSVHACPHNTHGRKGIGISDVNNLCH